MKLAYALIGIHFVLWVIGRSIDMNERMVFYESRSLFTYSIYLIFRLKLAKPLGKTSYFAGRFNSLQLRLVAASFELCLFYIHVFIILLVPARSDPSCTTFCTTTRTKFNSDIKCFDCDFCAVLTFQTKNAGGSRPRNGM